MLDTAEGNAHALSPTTVMQLPVLLLERVRRDPVLASHFRSEGSIRIQNDMLKAVLAELSSEERGAMVDAVDDEEALRVDDFREQEARAGLSMSDVLRWGTLLVDSLREAGVDARECLMAQRAVGRIMVQSEWRDHLDDAIAALDAPGAVDIQAVLGHLRAVRAHASAHPSMQSQP